MPRTLTAVSALFLIVCCIICQAVLQVPLGPLKTRSCTEHLAEIKLRQGRDTHWEPKCDADGTYSHTQMNKKSGLKFCVSRGGSVLVAPQRSLSDCECPRKRFEKFQSGNFEGFIFRCDTDFTYAVQQFNPSTNITQCLMKEGVVIEEYSGTRIVACKCPRVWYEAKTSPLPDRYIPQCHPDGTFKLKQCDKGRCFCINTEGEQISAMVPENEAAGLVCV